MDPRKNSGGNNRKLVYLHASGYFPNRVQENKPCTGHPPDDYTVPAGAKINRSINGGNDTGVQTSACCGKKISEQIYSLEAAARQKYLTAIQYVKPKMPSGWFNRYLEDRILPAFNRIGFDDSLTRSIFGMAAFAWQWMGPAVRIKNWCHPNLIKEIEEIRNGILLNTNRMQGTSRSHHNVSPGNPLRRVNDCADSRSLHGLPNTAAAPWIILPRIFQQLEKHHCRYLPAYLRVAETESNAECARIFIRILVHFTANYALKFAAKIHPEDRLAAVVVKGYEAMFWKNLRSPPKGLEEFAVFESFISWLKVFQTGNFSGFSGIDQIVSNMEAMKTQIFPPKLVKYQRQENFVAGDRFVVALRHGSRGIETLLDYFDRYPFLKKSATDSYLLCQPDLQSLNVFLQAAKTRFHSESPFSQRTIRRCLLYLKSSFEAQQYILTPSKNGCRSLLGFAGRRAVQMIQTIRDDQL